ncbi:VOC family protein [Kitasatospora terrestris]|uniref:VOC family protein n=1 Tax=Kitasatospora terrestris TaxID=258051 RepID=A0ABP9ERE5_9ACTN
MRTTHPGPVAVTGRCEPAVPCWAGLLTGSLPTALDFYGPLLGWEFDRPGGGRWVTARAAGTPVAFLAGDGPADRAAWIPYFGTEDADRTAELVRECGGTLAVGAIETRLGRFAVAADPQGAAFGIRQVDGVDACALGPGAPFGAELRCPDPFAAAVFYGEVFEWEQRPRIDIAFEDDRVVVRAGGVAAAALRRADGDGHDGQHARWEVLFAVPDLDRAVRRAAGLRGGVRRELGAGAARRVLLTDPQGARFAVLGAS